MWYDLVIDSEHTKIIMTSLIITGMFTIMASLITLFFVLAIIGFGYMIATSVAQMVSDVVSMVTEDAYENLPTISWMMDSEHTSLPSMSGCHTKARKLRDTRCMAWAVSYLAGLGYDDEKSYQILNMCDHPPAPAPATRGKRVIKSH